MLVKIKVNKYPRPKGKSKSKAWRKKIRQQLLAGLVILGLSGIVFWQDILLNIAKAVQAHSIVFEKAPETPTVTFLNQYPPGLEKTTPLVDRRVALLKQYLQSKKSPLAPYADVLVKHLHYRLILGIAFAESNFCKRNIKPHNCWGLGGGQPAAYPDYSYAISRADYFIQKYFEDGLTNPELMRNRWVGWQHPGWPNAVQTVAEELEAQGI